MAIYVPLIYTSYQIFADGRLIGHFGGMPPAPITFGGRNIFLLPADLASSGKPVTIAIRVWNWHQNAAFTGGGPHGALRIGDADVIRDWKSRELDHAYWGLSDNNLFLVISLLAFPAGFLLFAFRRTDREYLWFGIWQLLFTVLCVLKDYATFYAYRIHSEETLAGLIQVVAIPLPLLLFVVNLLRQQKDKVFWVAASCVAVLLVLIALVSMFWMSTATYNAFTTLFVLIYFVCVLTLLYRGYRQGIPDARLLIYPIGLLFATLVILQTVSTIVRTGRVESSQAYGYLTWLVNSAQWPFPFDFEDISELLVRLAILAILILRFARARADEQRIYAELGSARIVQSVLVPEKLPAIPGLSIRSVYKPAGRVGGDFFQIIPLQRVGGLVCIGDVSGKGLPAAMTVSLLVGTLRALSDTIQSPAKLLGAINRHMVVHSRGGFTTCLILRADPHGQFTVANAGTSPPI